MDDDDGGFEERPTPPGQFAAQERPTATEVARHHKSVPRGTPVVVMGDTERALHSRPYRRPPSEYTGDDVTSPRAVFDFERPDYATQIAELAMQLRRSGIDPLVASAALSVSLHREKERERTGKRELEEKLEEFLRVQPGGAKFSELERAVDDLARDIEDTRKPGAFDELARSVTELKNGMIELAPVRSLIRWIGWGLVISVLGGGLGIGGWLYARGGKETAVDMRLQALEKNVDKIVERLDQTYRRSHEDTHP